MKPTCLLETLSRSSVVTFPNPERRAFLLLFRQDAAPIGFQQLFQVGYLLLEHRAVVGVGHQRALVDQLHHLARRMDVQLVHHGEMCIRDRSCPWSHVECSVQLELSYTTSVGLDNQLWEYLSLRPQSCRSPVRKSICYP